MSLKIIQLTMTDQTLYTLFRISITPDTVLYIGEQMNVSIHEHPGPHMRQEPVIYSVSRIVLQNLLHMIGKQRVCTHTYSTGRLKLPIFLSVSECYINQFHRIITSYNRAIGLNVTSQGKSKPFIDIHQFHNLWPFSSLQSPKTDDGYLRHEIVWPSEQITNQISDEYQNYPSFKALHSKYIISIIVFDGYGNSTIKYAKQRRI